MAKLEFFDGLVLIERALRRAREQVGDKYGDPYYQVELIVYYANLTLEHNKRLGTLEPMGTRFL